MRPAPQRCEQTRKRRTLSLVLLPISARLKALQKLLSPAAPAPSALGHSNGSRSQKVAGASTKWYFARAARATSSSWAAKTSSGLRGRLPPSLDSPSDSVEVEGEEAGTRGLEERSGRDAGTR